MSVQWMVVRRVVVAVLSTYLVISVAFGFVAFTADPNIGELEYATALAYRNAPEEVREQKIEEAVAAYREARNLNDPIHERYARWLVSITTLDWGRSHSKGAPVTTLIARYLPYTLAYAIPAMAITVVLGTVGGYAAAVDRGSIRDRTLTLVGYVGVGIPNFWLAEAILLAYAADLHWVEDAVALGRGLWNAEAATAMVLPTLILTTGLVARTVHFTRSRSAEVLGTDRIKLVRAKGAGPRRIARHVLRDLAVPLIALVLTESMGVLLIGAFVVEHVFGIPGFGTLTFEAIRERDLPLVLGTTMVVAFVGIGGNLLQDLTHIALDPRVGQEE